MLALSVSTACFADSDHRVVGVDVNETKLATIRESRSPIIETDLGNLLKKGLKAGQIHTTLAASEVIVLGNKAAEFRTVRQQINKDQVIIDLVRIVEDVSQINGQYQGICW